MHCQYRFVLEVRPADGGRVLFREALHPDWEPAIEAARLVGLRAHGVWHQPGDGEPAVLPLWHERAGEPVVRGVRVSLTRNGHGWHADIPSTEFFAEAARTVVAGRVAAGTLAADDRVRYGVAAYAAAPAELPALAFTTTPLAQPIAVRDRGFAALVARSLECGEADAADLDVVVPESILEDMCRLTREAGERETGGILLGHVCRQETGGDVGVEITAHVPARHTVGDAVKLTFTSDTWTDVRAAVALRKAGELLVGWWHSHPAIAWCKACPIERQRVCSLSTGFLSSDDRALHRAMFPSAFTQALLVTHSAAGLETKLFGWRRGGLQPRGFHLLQDGHAAAAAARASVQPAGSATAPVAATGPACERKEEGKVEKPYATPTPSAS
jgi:proteasome lid subunit RPN8/RPN11